jgi:hypothetical protein
MGASLDAIKSLKEDLSKRYEMSDLGEMMSYLSIRIMRDRSLRHLEIDQSGYLTCHGFP